jgi:hypothetical protein
MLDVDAIALPNGIHATMLTGRDVVTGDQLAYPVVWADRSYDVCPGCHEPVDRVIEQRPAHLDTGAGPGRRDPGPQPAARVRPSGSRSTGRRYIPAARTVTSPTRTSCPSRPRCAPNSPSRSHANTSASGRALDATSRAP